MAGTAFFFRGSSTGLYMGLAIDDEERIPPPLGALSACCVSAKVRAIADTAAASIDLRILGLLRCTELSS
jgi:hypothetical protein